MRTFLLFGLISLLGRLPVSAQSVVRDQSLRYQQERMVNLQWDKNKFTPKAGFLSLNPYYWLTWGLFHPNYHKTDRRPLSVNGPQTQRLALVAALNATDNNYKLQSDTVNHTAVSEIANQSGLVTEADPLWQLYYKKELTPVIGNSQESILHGISPDIRQQVVSDGLYSWYKNELDMLKERIDAAHTTNIDRGSRIMAYHRYLMEYRKLAGVWTIRTAAARRTTALTQNQQRLKAGSVAAPAWTPQTDIDIARKVLLHVQ